MNSSVVSPFLCHDMPAKKWEKCYENYEMKIFFVNIVNISEKGIISAEIF